MRRRAWIEVLGWTLLTAPAMAQAPSPLEVQARALERAAAAVVGVQAEALEDARSNATLGRLRQGSGVVIDDRGLVLTIGYLVLEAEQVQLLLDDGRELPARVVAYDLATGFGLVQALVPLGVTPAPLHRGTPVGADDSLMVVSGQPFGDVSAARLVSRRPFSGTWEYRIEGALFTAPARSDHSGAGLFSAQGELLGIGSLRVSDAAGPFNGRVPGNMFVPVELLRPVLAELVRTGTSAASRRAWLGVNCTEQGGRVRVIRIHEDGPADTAGLRVGDVIVAIDGTPVSTLETLWTRLWNGGPPARTVTLDVERTSGLEQVTVQTVDRRDELRRASGI